MNEAERAMNKTQRSRFRADRDVCVCVCVFYGVTSRSCKGCVWEMGLNAARADAA